MLHAQDADSRTHIAAIHRHLTAIRAAAKDGEENEALRKLVRCTRGGKARATSGGLAVSAVSNVAVAGRGRCLQPSPLFCPHRLS